MKQYFIHKIDDKLILLSRNINVGDEVTWLGKYQWAYLQKILIGDEKNKDIFLKEFSKKEKWGVIVGEVSPEATWVKEGDEFDEEELCLFWKAGFGSGTQKHVLPFEDPEDDCYVGIKGPCGHFH